MPGGGTVRGAQRLRASLTRVLGGERPPTILVLDEPTNHLHLDSIQAIERALRRYGRALLVVSHDRDFIEAIEVGRTVEFGRGSW